MKMSTTTNMVVVDIFIDFFVVENIQGDELDELIWRFNCDNRSLESLLIAIQELLHIIAFASEHVLFERFDEVAKVVRC